MRKAKVCLLYTDGINCNVETGIAFEKVGGDCTTVHTNELRTNPGRLLDFPILAISGGFSNGDDIAAGKVLAIELTTYLGDYLLRFIERGGLVLGICNGFQVLVRSGLLPFGQLGTMSATLTCNERGVFDCRWVELAVTNSRCVFTTELAGRQVEYQTAHQQGRWWAELATMRQLREAGQIVLQYNYAGQPTTEHPYNPNGSLEAVAGVCDPTGRIFGLMPHPERYIEVTHHPNWRRGRIGQPHGLPIFEQAVRLVS